MTGQDCREQRCLGKRLSIGMMFALGRLWSKAAGLVRRHGVRGLERLLEEAMHTDPIRPGTLNELAAVEQDPCVSILLPTHTSGRETRQDPIRLENLLDQVQEQLKSRGMRRPDSEMLLKPARDVINDSNFWQFQGEALAVYLAEGMTRLLRLPEAVDESVMVGPRFNIKPLLGSMVSSEPFYVLALTKEQARLYRGTRSEFEEIVTAGFPLVAADAVGIREPVPELQHHGGKPPRGGRGDRGFRGDSGQANYHGHGEGEQKIEADLMHYLKDVAAQVGDYLYGDEAPLVLAADVAIFGWYCREHLRGRLVESDHVESPDTLKPHELRERAWKIVSPLLEADLSSWLDRFGTAAASGRAAQGFEEVATAAAQGKIDTLFFDPRASQLGWLADGGTTAHLVNSSEAADGQQTPAEDLVNRAIIDTLRTGGRAIPLAAARGREGRDVDPQPPKAILRY